MIKKLLLTISLSSSLLFAQTGLEIMQKVLDRDDGDNIITNMQMQLIDKNGHKRIRDMKTFSKEMESILDQFLVNAKKDMLQDQRAIENEIRQVVRKHIFRKMKKYPTIVPTIFVMWFN